MSKAKDEVIETVATKIAEAADDPDDFIPPKPEPQCSHEVVGRKVLDGPEGPLPVFSCVECNTGFTPIAFATELSLRQHATAIMQWMRTLDAGWDNKIAAMIDERHIDDLQALGILAGNTLETGSYMDVPVVPQLIDGFQSAGTDVRCPQCRRVYVRAYAGQPYCSNRCADIHRGIVRPVTHAGMAATPGKAGAAQPDQHLSKEVSFRNREKHTVARPRA